MKKGIAPLMVLTLLLTSVLVFAVNVQPVNASGTIYIRADGSIDPSAAAISTFDNITYTFEDNIMDSIVVQRGNVTIDGRGYTLQGAGTGIGMNVSQTNVVIKDIEIRAFEFGIKIDNSSNSKVCGNEISSNTCGISIRNTSSTWIYENRISSNTDNIRFEWNSSYNVISENNITSATNTGIDFITMNHDNNISRNNITNNAYGIWFEQPSSNSNRISRNNIAYNNIGAKFGSSDNSICHNNFVNNTIQAETDSVNIWDYGYPSGGNYWSDYQQRYPNAMEIDDSGIWDTPYTIDPNNKDNYPLRNPYDIFPHNVAVTDVTFSKDIVCQNCNMNISVIVENYGDYNETFNVTLNRLGHTVPMSLVANHVTGWNGTMPGPTIIVNASDTIRLNLTSSNPIVDHNFFVDYDGDRTPSPGEPNSPDFYISSISYEFVANKPGNFTYYCRYHKTNESGAFTVNPTATTEKIDLLPVSPPLEPGEVRVLPSIWNATGVPKDNYTINAVADTVPSETNTTNNSFTDGWVIVSMLGDLNGPEGFPFPDGTVDGSDIIIYAKSYGSYPGHSEWRPDCDITNDGVIDGSDLIIVSRHYGEKDP